VGVFVGVAIGVGEGEANGLGEVVRVGEGEGFASFMPFFHTSFVPDLTQVNL